MALRKATKSVDGDYSGIIPRHFHRTLKMESRGDSRIWRFQISKHQGHRKPYGSRVRVSVKKPGTVSGRLLAESDRFDIGARNLGYRPYGQHSALAVTVGHFLLLLGLGSIEHGILGLLLVGAGAYEYWQTESGDFPIIRQDVIPSSNNRYSERTNG